MAVIQRILELASKDRRKIALAEGEDLRMIQAARRLHDEKLADVLLLGKLDAMKKTAAGAGVSLAGIELIDPASSPDLAKYAERFHEKRKSKGMTPEKALETLRDPLYFAALMLDSDAIDGFVAGAVNSTANVFRAGLQVIGLAEGIKTASSCFLMVVPDCEYGANGAFIYSDCGLLPFPDAAQLADIAMASHAMAKALLQTTPILALLSFSTAGSAQHENLNKILEAKKILNTSRPDILADGELQADAALIPSIGASKCPGSKVAGKANVLIFPDLNAGNIAYKLTERLAKATAIGPLPQGFAKPFSDLSRGCNANDIVIASAIVSVQASERKPGAKTPASPPPSSGGVNANSDEELVRIISDMVVERIRTMKL
ncbi:MAG: phosphate acetyltransferase [Spirochaetota bacterium]|jgi:phosphate acetyltransferase|nr:phosphate acetyltransferase [Spirochaetota bacterium]